MMTVWCDETDWQKKIAKKEQKSTCFAYDKGRGGSHGPQIATEGMLFCWGSKTDGECPGLVEQIGRLGQN